MATETQSWWSGHYDKYSLQNLASMPIFTTFRAQKKYYKQSDDIRTEMFWTYDNCNIYEWFMHAENKGEKLGYDGWGRTWFYEVWTPEEDHELVVKTWLKSSGDEWGLIIRRYRDKEVREKWSQIKGAKTHEIEESVGPKTSSHKTGFAGANEWVDDRVLFADSGNEHGSSVGVKDGQRFETKWEVNDPNRMESKEFWSGDRNWGQRFRQRGPGWIREDWEGLRPDSGSGGGADYSRNALDVYEEAINALKSSEATLEKITDPANQSQLDHLRSERESLPRPSADDVASILDATSRALRLLQEHERLKREEQLVPAAEAEAAKKELQDRLAELEAANKQLQDRLAEAETANKQLQDQQTQLAPVAEVEAAKKDLQDQLEQVANNMDTLYQIMHKNDSVCDTLAAALKDEETQKKLDEFEGEFERINSEFEDSQDPAKLSEMLNLLLKYQPINYEMAGRLHGLTADQSAADMSDAGKGGLKQQRAKVRSARPTSSAFDVIGRAIDRDLDLAATALGEFTNDPTGTDRANEAKGAHGDPIVVITKKIDVLTELLTQLTEASPFGDAIDKTNEHLTLAAAAIEGLTGDAEPKEKAEAARAIEGHPLDMLAEKMTVLDDLLKTLSDLELQEESTKEETSNVVSETREETTRLVELKDAELVRLKSELDKREKVLGGLRTEIEELSSDREALRQLQADYEILRTEHEKLRKQLAS